MDHRFLSNYIVETKDGEYISENNNLDILIHRKILEVLNSNIIDWDKHAEYHGVSHQPTAIEFGVIDGYISVIVTTSSGDDSNSTYEHGVLKVLRSHFDYIDSLKDQLRIEIGGVPYWIRVRGEFECVDGALVKSALTYEGVL